jgi:hypothetical protein
MKTFHSLSLFSLSAATLCWVKKGRVLSKKQYNQILLVTCALSFLYFMPAMYMAKLTFNAPDLTGARMFADWSRSLIENMKLGVISCYLAFALHLNIYFCIYGLQFGVLTINQIITRIEAMNTKSHADYTSIELENVLDFT